MKIKSHLDFIIKLVKRKDKNSHLESIQRKNDTLYTIMIQYNSGITKIQEKLMATPNGPTSSRLVQEKQTNKFTKPKMLIQPKQLQK